MSSQAAGWVWEHSGAEGITLLVALAVAESANAKGRESCLSVTTIAAMTKVSERTVQRALRTLVEAGEIRPTGTHPQYRTTIYSLPRMGDKAMSPIEPAEGDIAVTPQGDKTGGLRVTKSAVEGDTAMSHYLTTYLTTTQTTSDSDESDGLFDLAESEAQPDPAKLILDYWWRRQNPRPAGRRAWHQSLGAIGAVLQAGHEPKAVQDAVCGLKPPLTTNRLEIALNGTGPATSVRDTYSTHWQNGGGFTAEEGRPSQ